MGFLHHGADRYDLDDRVLHHVRRVIVQKLKRNESFLLSWTSPTTSLPQSAWIAPRTALGFEFSGSRPPALNRSWTERLMSASYSTVGLDLDTSPEEPETVRRGPSGSGSSTPTAARSGRR